MTALTFALSDLETGRPLGQALICLEARYASIAWRGAARLDRKFAGPALWLAIERDVQDRIQSGPLAQRSAIVRLFSLMSGQVAQVLAQTPVEASPGAVAATLDALLRGMAA